MHASDLCKLSPQTATMIDEVLSDPSSSEWVKTALLDLLRRDPIDALNDLDTLLTLMQKRLADIADGLGE